MDNSVTQWLREVANHDEAAVGKVWDRYCHSLSHLARRWLGERARRVVDEEDVVLSVFNSMCEGLAAGKFTHVHDREDLWKLLVTITARKAMAKKKWYFAKRRGGGMVQGESALRLDDDSSADDGIGQVLGTEPTPELAVLAAEELDRLLNLLHDDDLRKIAIYRMEGHDVAEIGRKMDCCLRTVKRRLRDIRKAWEEELEKK